MIATDNEILYKRLIAIINGDLDVKEVVNTLGRMRLTDMEKDMVIELFEVLLEKNTNRLINICNSLISTEYFMNDHHIRYKFIVEWICDMYQRSDEFMYPANEILSYVIRSNHYIIPDHMLKNVLRLNRRYRLDIFHTIIIHMDNIYMPVSIKIDRLKNLNTQLFNMDISDIFKDNNIFSNNIFYNWTLTPEDLVYVMKNNGRIGRDGFIQYIHSKIELGSYIDGDTDIEDLLFDCVRAEILDADENIKSMSMPDLVRLVDERWDILSVYERISISYYLHVYYDEDLLMNLLIDKYVRKTYSILYYYYVVVCDDRLNNAESTEEFRYTKENTSAIALLDRLCM